MNNGINVTMLFTLVVMGLGVVAVCIDPLAMRKLAAWLMARAQAKESYKLALAENKRHWQAKLCGEEEERG